MTELLQRPAFAECAPARRQQAIVEFLRAMVLTPDNRIERLHALFVDEQRGYVMDTALGRGADNALSVRMRELFRKALSVNARGIIIAHNHPSGLCRPSQCDIESTRHLRSVALALDIELVDHLIFTPDAAYSMRAGGEL